MTLNPETIVSKIVGGRHVQPFSYCGIDIFELDKDALRDLLANELERHYKFTFKWL